MADPPDAELLSAVKQALSGTLTRNAAQYSVAGRSLQSFSLTELIALRNALELRIAAAAGARRTSVVTFRDPS